MEGADGVLQGAVLLEGEVATKTMPYPGIVLALAALVAASVAHGVLQGGVPLEGAVAREKLTRVGIRSGYSTRFTLFHSQRSGSG